MILSRKRIKRRWSVCADAQAGLRLCCSQPLEDRFCRDEAYFICTVQNGIALFIFINFCLIYTSCFLLRYCNAGPCIKYKYPTLTSTTTEEVLAPVIMRLFYHVLVGFNPLPLSPTPATYIHPSIFHGPLSIRPKSSKFDCQSCERNE